MAIVDKISLKDDICIAGKYFPVSRVIDVVLENWKLYFVEEDIIEKLGGREDFTISTVMRYDTSSDTIRIFVTFFAPNRKFITRNGVNTVQEQEEVRITRMIYLETLELYELLTTHA